MRADDYPISELAPPSLIRWMFSAGGASRALDLCETRLNHAIFLNRQAIFSLFIQIYKNKQLQTTWTTLLETYLNLLLLFKQNRIRLGAS